MRRTAFHLALPLALGLSCGGTMSSGDNQQPCDPGLTRCGWQCVDLQLNASNCGQCDYYCGLAPCNAGTCGAMPTLVVSGGSNGILGIAVDSNNLYFTTPSEVIAVPQSGGTPVSIGYDPTGEGNHADLGVSDGRVYWMSSHAIMSVPTQGGAVEHRDCGPGASAYGMAVDGSGVYWSDLGAGAIWHVTGDLASQTLVASGLDEPRGIVLDDTSVYWATNAGTVWRLSKQGGNPVAIGSDAAWPVLAANASGVFFARRGFADWLSLVRVSPEGGQPQELSACRGSLVTVAADSAAVYWGLCLGSGTLAVPSSGGAAQSLYSGEPFKIAGGADWVFVLEAEEDRIFRVPRTSR